MSRRHRPVARRLLFVGSGFQRKALVIWLMLLSRWRHGTMSNWPAWAPAHRLTSVLDAFPPSRESPGDVWPRCRARSFTPNSLLQMCSSSHRCQRDSVVRCSKPWPPSSRWSPPGSALPWICCKTDEMACLCRALMRQRWPCGRSPAGRWTRTASRKSRRRGGITARRFTPLAVRGNSRAGVVEAVRRHRVDRSATAALFTRCSPLKSRSREVYERLAPERRVRVLDD